MRMRGIVLDINEQGAIVIDNEGQYTKIKNNEQLVIGVMVEYTEKDVVGLEKKSILSVIKANGKVIYPAACAAILVFIIGMFSLYTSKSVNSTFAYIDVDINPSIELKVNQDECIIGIKTLNKDSEKLCENIDFIGKKAESGVVDIINKSLEMGYFHDDKKIVMVAGALKVNGKLTTDKYEKLNDKMGNLIEKIKNKVNNGKEDVELVAFHTSPLKLKEAQKKNISLGRYSIYANAEDEGIKLALDDAKKLKISELFNLLPEKDFTYFEDVQRQAAIDVKLIKEEGNDKKVASSEVNKKNEKADQTSKYKGLNKNKLNTQTRKPADSDDKDKKITPEPSATAVPSKNSNKDEDTKNNDNGETSNNNQNNDDANSTTDKEGTSTSENNNDKSKNTDNNSNDNTNSNNTHNDKDDQSNNEKNDNTTQNNGQNNNSSNVSTSDNNNGNGNDKKNGSNNGKNHGNSKNTNNDIQSTATPIVEANNTATSIVNPTKAQTPEVSPVRENTPAPVQTPSPVSNQPSATVDNTNKNSNSKNDSAPGQTKKETKTESGNGNPNKNKDR